MIELDLQGQNLPHIAHVISHHWTTKVSYHCFDPYQLWVWLALTMNFIFNFKTYFSTKLDSFNVISLICGKIKIIFVSGTLIYPEHWWIKYIKQFIYPWNNVVSRTPSHCYNDLEPTILEPYNGQCSYIESRDWVDPEWSIITWKCKM